VQTLKQERNNREINFIVYKPYLQEIHGTHSCLNAKPTYAKASVDEER
jgi:hypothetical protein